MAGVPHESFGDVSMAFIVLEKGSKLTEEVHLDVNIMDLQNLNHGYINREFLPKMEMLYAFFL